MKSKGTVFIEHIQKHIMLGDEGLHDTDKVVCKICGKSVEEIWQEYVDKEHKKGSKQK